MGKTTLLSPQSLWEFIHCWLTAFCSIITLECPSSEEARDSSSVFDILHYKALSTSDTTSAALQREQHHLVGEQNPSLSPAPDLGEGSIWGKGLMCSFKKAAPGICYLSATRYLGPTVLSSFTKHHTSTGTQTYARTKGYHTCWLFLIAENWICYSKPHLEHSAGKHIL